ncbi:MAG TPA: WhiB family transcriptional regulator [Pseudonocardia sp.]|jgi:WhiB family redox-sensing transcriptional regulator
MYVVNIPPEGGGSTGSGPSISLVPDLGGLLAAEEPETPLPCRTDEADLWFAERPEQLGRAQELCRGCPIRRQCLAGALNRREPWGVWGGEIFERGRVIPFKRGRGRPSKPAVA